MTGPFHHDVRGDAEGEGVDDEGAAAGVGANEFPLGLDLVGADVVLEGGILVFLQNIPGNLVQFDGDAVRCLDGRDLDVVSVFRQWRDSWFQYDVGIV